MHRPNPEGGYALILMLVLLVTGSLYIIVNRLDSSTLQAARTAETVRALQQAKNALLAYALTYRESHPDEDTGDKLAGYGYLPCPDLWSDDGIGMYGTAAGNCGANGTISIGLLPYRSLGLPELRDGDGNCLWYAVSGTHKSNTNSNSLNWDTRSQIEILDANGSITLASAGSAGGAAAIVFAAGAAINNAMLQQASGREPLNKPCGTDSTQAAAYLESFASPMSNGTRKAADGNLVSNDRLIWIGATELYAAVLKRETTFPAYLNTDLVNLAATLTQYYDQNTPSGGNRLTQLNTNGIVTTANTRAQNFAQQWADHLWFRKCNPSCNLPAPPRTCSGVLIWSGSGGSMPRTTADYLDTPNTQTLMSNATGPGSLSDADVVSEYTLTTPSKDVAHCLKLIGSS